MSVEGIKKLKKYFEYLEKQAPKVNELFLKESLEYIKLKANEHLKESYNPNEEWYTRTGVLEKSWNITINDWFGTKVGELENIATYSAYVEYGTGIASAYPGATMNGYVPNMSGKGETGWLFEHEGETIFTHGQTGYWYLFDAVYNDYIMSGKVQEVFDSCFRKVCNIT